MRQPGPKTHLLVLLLASILAILIKDDLQVHMMVALSVVYLVLNRLSRKVLPFILVYVLSLAVSFAMPETLGTMKLVFYSFARMMPLVMIGATLMYSPPGSIMCVLERMSVPRPITVMICILIRFFPVVLLEMKAIRDGIRARGIFPHWYSALLHPAMAYECYFMPLVVRCLKLSAELASSAELRGIESDCARTSIHAFHFRTADAVALVIYIIAATAIYGAGGMMA
ncbi:energy-coupling factor transporter transmembrane component T [Brevibacillus agri]|uniref:energy-coupling factor transporter transmembrane component T family protein n=1 Tax=Brevibacillus agri TaxID=51101 RepID=UPI002E1BAFB2|nr:energy-coupling factor transporter transmembrane component T [Brevibacillus agri]MED1655516.1 energy-coupling factor transporter transmembrane component T [Brevibacillus agri]MED1687344.1 energy-coupling factor transporter transmembrane component T [Brevibacillus agri]MED1692089.1 energy-coupling factor transporter transmembrane component T [Brevibacillus agri]MED1697919.1 energy-coupling factor transporter transmembrane component T [Brevibacillus agri]